MKKGKTFLLTMKKSCLITILLVLIFLGFTLRTQAEVEELVPPGMELRVVGQASMLVPQDAEIQEKGGLIIIEQIDKYVARTLFEMKQQMKDLKVQQEKLSKEVEQLKAELANKNN
ncbi:MAG: hypothetical protein KKD05_00540 [Candidatus Omnitrophica bacterium]|nr:hypothetical protein [Candidatus Omnitrophota bacterium]